MKLKKRKTINLLIGVFTGILAISACGKMDATYKDFLKKGSIVYAGAADSVKVYSGNERLKLSWLLSDPSVTKASIYWNNKTDSAIVSIKELTNSNKLDVWLNNMKEGSYSFDIRMHDEQGNSSVNVNTIGRVYGENYITSLLARPVRSALYKDGKVEVDWGSGDSDVIGTEIIYNPASGENKVITVAADALKTTLENYDFDMYSSFTYRTLYKPDSMAVDTFYSVAQTVNVQGPPIEYVKTDWTAPAEEYDVPSGRVPQNALDNNTSTVWHMDKNKSYPHQILVDMKVSNVIYGFTYNQRTPLDGAAKLVEIQISSDNVNWESLGSYTFENNANRQFLELLDPVTCRYFKMIFRSDYKNGNFTAIAEIGAYRR